MDGAKDRKVHRAKVTVTGGVQGVWFRGTTRETARSLGLSGYVKNLPDGRVEAVFEGPLDAVNQAIYWCHQGPPAARVESVNVEWLEPKGESGFRISF